MLVLLLAAHHSKIKSSAVDFAEIARTSTDVYSHSGRGTLLALNLTYFSKAGSLRRAPYKYRLILAEDPHPSSLQSSSAASVEPSSLSHHELPEPHRKDRPVLHPQKLRRKGIHLHPWCQRSPHRPLLLPRVWYRFSLFLPLPMLTRLFAIGSKLCTKQACQFRQAIVGMYLCLDVT